MTPPIDAQQLWEKINYHTDDRLDLDDLAIIAAALDARELKWTTEKPTRAGWYWYRHPKWEDLEPVIVQIVILPQTDTLTILWTATNQSVENYTGTGQWSGPLEPPTEPLPPRTKEERGKIIRDELNRG